MQEFIFSYQSFRMLSKRPSRKRPAQRRKSHKRKNLQFCATVCKCFLQKGATRGLNAVNSIVNPWDKAWDTRGTVWDRQKLGRLLGWSFENVLFGKPGFLEFANGGANVAVNACYKPPQFLFGPRHKICYVAGLVTVRRVRREIIV